MGREYTKESGKMINDAERVLNSIRVATLTKENLRVTKLMGEAFTNGLKVRSTMANGVTERKKAMVYGEVSMEIAT